MLCLTLMKTWLYIADYTRLYKYSDLGMLTKEDTNMESIKISTLSDIFVLGKVIIISVCIIVFIILIVKGFITIDKIIIGPFEGKFIKIKFIETKVEETKVEETKEDIVPVYRISILRQPTSVSGNPAMLNTLQVRVYDRDGNPLKNKRVSITLEGKENNPESYISGSLSETSDDKGDVVFSGLTLLKRGLFSIVFHADEAFAKAKPFNVMPPGLDVDFEGKPFGSDQYIGALQFAISLNKASDKVIMNGEEIN